MSDSRQRVRHFYTKVVGVTHKNSDRTSRQGIIERCKPWEKLILEHEEDNPVDPNAIKVCRENGEQIGYLSADQAPRFVQESKEGYRFAAFISDLTGGRKDAPTRGVNLLVVVGIPGVTDREAQKYVDSVWDALHASLSASFFSKLEDSEDEPRGSRRQYLSRGKGGGTDAPGVISLIFGSLAVACLLMGCFTCGATYYAAVPFALLGALVGFFGKGNMRVAGLLLNFLALLPAIVVLMGVLGVIGLGSSAAVVLKNPETSETQSSEHGSPMTKQDELINKAKAMNKRTQDGGNKPGTHSDEERRRKEQEKTRQEEERKSKDPAEIKRRADATKKADEERNGLMKEEAEARKMREKVDPERRAKENEVSAASKLKFAKSLHTASLDAVGQESVRLEREYVNSLSEIIKKYPMTKAAKEAKELLDKMGR